MSKNKVAEAKWYLKRFCNEFITKIKENTNILMRLGINILASLPKVFISENISFDCVYSIKREHVLIIFKSNNNKEFNFKTVTEDVFDFLDTTGSWKNSGVGFRINDCTEVSLKDCSINGMKPFEIIGSNIEIFIENLIINVPIRGNVNVEYGIILSMDVMRDRLDEMDYFCSSFVRTFLEYHKLLKINNSSDKTDLVNGFKKIKLKMEEYFFNEEISEGTIDNFLENNPIVLEQCLNLINSKSQLTLDVLIDPERFSEKNLKPDLIAYDKFENRWIVVDYKRAKRKIIKNLNNVRSGFKAEVLDLQNQLKDYIEYFDEKEHRNYILEKYNINIEYPSSIGIIGNISKEEITTFNRHKRDLPTWFKVIPYNFLYTKFCDFINISEKIKNS